MKDRCRNCGNCMHLDTAKRIALDGRLNGGYRYGCRLRESGCINGILSKEGDLTLFSCEGWQDGITQGTEADRLRQRYDVELQELFVRWTSWDAYGSPDAAAPDGVCLNRLRDAIRMKIQKIEKELPEEKYPESYYSPLPPVRDEWYMADCQGIRRAAGRALEQYENHEDYLWLAGQITKLKNNPKEYKEAYRLMSHADALRQAVSDDDCFRMKAESRQEHLFVEMAELRAQLLENGRKRRRHRRVSARVQITGQMKVTELKAS